MGNMKNDKITIEIKSNSKKCEHLRDDGIFFETIADVLGIKREDIKEINTGKKYDKSRSN